MVIVSQEITYGLARLNATDNLGNPINQDLVEIRFKVGSFPNFPEAHFSAVTATIEITSLASSVGTNSVVGIAIVEDNSDPNGDFTVGGTVVSWLNLGNIDALNVGDQFSVTLGNKAGTLRAVLTMGNDAASSQDRDNVDQGALSLEYHIDSDGNVVTGGASLLTQARTRWSGWVGRRAVVASLTSSQDPNQGYTMQPTLSGDLNPRNAAASGFINPKNVAMAVRRTSDKLIRVNKSVAIGAAAGAIGPSSSYNVDTLFDRASTSHQIAIGVNNTLGNATTPSDQLPGLAGLGITVTGLANTQRAWLYFDTAGHTGATPDATNPEGNFAIARDTVLNIGHGVTVRSLVVNSSNGAGTGVYNRGETYNADLRFNNVHGTEIDPDNTVIRVHSASHGVERTQPSDSAAPYVIAYPTLATHAATFDTTGSPKHPHVTFGHYGANDPVFDYDGVDQSLTTLFSLSRKLLLHSVQVTLPTHNDRALATSSRETGQGAATIFNRSEAIRVQYFLGFARGAAYASQSNVTSEAHVGNPLAAGTDPGDPYSNDGHTVEESQTTLATTATGQLTHDYTIGSGATSTYDQVGHPRHIRAIHSGNVTDDSLASYAVSRKILIGDSNGDNDRSVATVAQGAGDGAQDLFNRGEQIRVQPHVFYARGTPYRKLVTVAIHDGASAGPDLESDSHTTETSGTTTPNAAGLATFDYTPGATHATTWDFVGQPKHLRITQGGNTSDDSIADWSLSRRIMVGSAVGSDNGAIVTEADSAGQGLQDVFNRGETIGLLFFLSYARGTAYAGKSVTINVHDGDRAATETDAHTSEEVLTPTTGTGGNAGRLDISYVAATTDAALATLGTGQLKHLRATGQDNTSAESVADWQLSRSLALHSAAVAAPTDNDLSIVNVGGVSLRNRGETHAFEYYLGYARGLPYANQTTITQTVEADDNTVEDSQTNETTNASGQVASSYLIATTDKATFDFVGSPKSVTVSHQGNTTTETTDSWRVSRKLMLGAAAGSNDLSVVARIADSSANGYVDTGSLIGTTAGIYNRGETVRLQYALSFARGAAYASQTITTAVHTDDIASAEEDAQNVATTAAGVVDYTYLTVSADKATADTLGSPKHVEVSHNGNTTDDSAEAWSLSSFYYFDTHPQKIGTLDPDDFPLEDANEVFGTYVILGDLLNVWLHVEGVRNDGTEVNTTGTPIHLQYDDPDGTIIETFNVNSAPVASNGNLDGWTARIRPAVTTPAGNWTLTGSVTYLGNTGEQAHIITIGSPLVADKRIKIWTEDVTPLPGGSLTVYVRTEKKQGEPPLFVAQAPDETPFLGLGHVEAGTPETWSEDISDTAMVNVLDETATVNGALYKHTMTLPATPGVYLITIRAQMDGADIQTHHLIHVLPVDGFMVDHQHIGEYPWDLAIGDRGLPG